MLLLLLLFKSVDGRSLGWEIQSTRVDFGLAFSRFDFPFSQFISWIFSTRCRQASVHHRPLKSTNSALYSISIDPLRPSPVSTLKYTYSEQDDTVNKQTRRTAMADSHQGSSSTNQEVPGSQSTFHGINGLSPEMEEYIRTCVDRVVEEKLQQLRFQAPGPHIMIGSKPELYYGRNRAEKSEFIMICEANFLSARWGPDQETQKVAYASSFLRSLPAQEWILFIHHTNINTVSWEQFKAKLI